MKKSVKKNTSIDDLAIMVANGFSSVDKRFDGVNEKFDDIEKRFEGVDKRFDIVEDRLETLEEVVKNIRRDVLNIGDKFVERYEFDNLLNRFGRLEKKVDDKLKK